jgi:hypothetical protein
MGCGFASYRNECRLEGEGKSGGGSDATEGGIFILAGAGRRQFGVK